MNEILIDGEVLKRMAKALAEDLTTTKAQRNKALDETIQARRLLIDLKSKLKSLIEKWQREVDTCGYYMEYDVKWKCIKELKEIVE